MSPLKFFAHTVGGGIATVTNRIYDGSTNVTALRLVVTTLTTVGVLAASVAPGTYMNAAGVAIAERDDRLRVLEMSIDDGKYRSADLHDLLVEAEELLASSKGKVADDATRDSLAGVIAEGQQALQRQGQALRTARGQAATLEAAASEDRLIDWIPAVNDTKENAQSAEETMRIASLELSGLDLTDTITEAMSSVETSIEEKKEADRKAAEAKKKREAEERAAREAAEQQQQWGGHDHSHNNNGGDWQPAPQQQEAAPSSNGGGGGSGRAFIEGIVRGIAGSVPIVWDASHCEGGWTACGRVYVGGDGDQTVHLSPHTYDDAWFNHAYVGAHEAVHSLHSPRLWEIESNLGVTMDRQIELVEPIADCGSQLLGYAGNVYGCPGGDAMKVARYLLGR